MFANAICFCKIYPMHAQEGTKNLHILLQALSGEGDVLTAKVGREDTTNELSLADNAESGALAVVLMNPICSMQ